MGLLKGRGCNLGEKISGSYLQEKKEEGRRKKEEGRRKKEEGRRKKEEGRRKERMMSRCFIVY